MSNRPSTRRSPAASRFDLDRNDGHPRPHRSHVPRPPALHGPREAWRGGEQIQDRLDARYVAATDGLISAATLLPAEPVGDRLLAGGRRENVVRQGPRLRSAFPRALPRLPRGCRPRRVRGLAGHAEGALALVLLLDQYPAQCLPRHATHVCDRRRAGARRRRCRDRRGPRPGRRGSSAVFFYLPFGHSKLLSDQEQIVELAGRLGDPNHSRARHHCDIVRRFSHFPHRNTILGHVNPRPRSSDISMRAVTKADDRTPHVLGESNHPLTIRRRTTSLSTK